MVVSNFVVISAAVFVMMKFMIYTCGFGSSSSSGTGDPVVGWSFLKTIHFRRSSPLFTHISIYHLVIQHSHGKSPFLIGKPSISMGHLYHGYDGYVSHNQRVDMSYIWRFSPTILDPLFYSQDIWPMSKTVKDWPGDRRFLEPVRVEDTPLPHPCTNFIQFPHQPIDWGMGTKLQSILGTLW